MLGRDAHGPNIDVTARLNRLLHQFQVSAGELEIVRFFRWQENDSRIVWKLIKLLGILDHLMNELSQELQIGRSLVLLLGIQVGFKVTHGCLY